MTKEAREIAAAFRAGKPLRKHHTHTDGQNVWLFGKPIAWRDEKTGVVYVTLAGWPSVTTRDRINAILDAFGVDFHVVQRMGVQHRWNFKTHSLEPWLDPMPLAGPLGMMALDAERLAA